MKVEYGNPTKIFIVIFIFLLAVISIFLFIEFMGLNSYVQIVEKENLLYKIILRADNKFSEVSLDSQEAENYYDEAIYFYENEDYKLVESNCRLARDHYSKESQGYKKIKAELLSSEIEDKLISIYVNILDSIIEATNNMYEACEYFESASRYYDKYYNTDVPYDDPSYDMADAEMDIMNEKITAHDIAIERYNQYLEDFGVELEKRLIE